MNAKPHILVIGDVMLDTYISGGVTRISPEAPVPVVKVDNEWSALGGAGNVAANVSGLGGNAILLGVVGEDESGNMVREKCATQGIEFHPVKSAQPTITKTRIVSGQQIVRVDREEQLKWTDRSLADLDSKLQHLVEKCQLILLSDYAKGTLSDAVLKLVFDQANQQGVRVLVDPKRADWSVYQGAFAITPNLAELQMTQHGESVINEDNSIVAACHALGKAFAVENVVATRSSYGMTVVGKSGVLNIPTRALEVFDVSGAGDTVLAALGVALAEGKSVSESAFFANAAAGIAVSKRGTAVVDRSEVDKLIMDRAKVVSRSDIASFRAAMAPKKVVFTNGCFDVLHQGHRALLKEAKGLGDLLVVGLNSDDSISRLKGDDRPINRLQQRIESLSALPYVDAIIVFEEDTPLELLEALRPQILVKGGDYEASEVIGSDLVGEVIIVPLVEGVSTTELLKA